MEEDMMKNILHLKAPGSWINDPNGFIYYKGKYHLFYQYFPAAPVWGTMHWGHAVSEDLIHWEHLGIALFPTKYYDRNGVFSGSAIELDGKMQLYYTAVRYKEENPENIHSAADGVCFQSQATISSKDGLSFDNWEDKTQIIPPIEDTTIADPFDCRDPKVWKEKDTYYMCLASTHEKQAGVLLVLESPDGKNWSYFGRVEDKRLGHTLECPDLFAIDGQYMLICSPMGILKGTDCQENQSIVFPVRFDPKEREIALEPEGTLSEEPHFLDYGMDLYAPQSNLDAEGRRVIISWMRMPIPVTASHNTASEGRPWNGMMALPRVAIFRDGVFCTPVHPNVRAYFEDAVRVGVTNRTENGELWYQFCQKGTDSQILTHIKEGQTLNLNGYEITLKKGHICTDRTKLLPKFVALNRTARSPYVGSECDLEIYLDQNLIEIFIDDGRFVISQVIYPD